ncbi:DUF6379 domain-containing protein [Novosphingobium sp. KA1]|uniref:C-glycoside deglycosidase beta subunit domain-containing protein n=1 Tax=Novosphingobium sp. (strain KA1) TaxID=164608 RepID=UPI001A8E5049|nr:DUF6379 domain-containing protein [Novosphingobium sp. KA1]
MFDKYLIDTHGFRTYREGGVARGFEFGMRIAYYRGVALTIIAGLKIRIDGDDVDGASIRLVVAGRVFTLEEAAREEDVRWEFDTAIIVRVLREGGLPAGAHDIAVEQRIKPAYMPPAVNFVGNAAKRITLVDSADGGSGQIMLGVSLYSYQEEFYTRSLSLEDCLGEVASIGAQGVQLIGEQMMRGYPALSTNWVEAWHKGVERFGLTPTVLDTFVDVDCGGHRRLSLEEGVAKLVEQMQLAKLLGFPFIRPTTGPVEDAAPELIERALEHAERLGVAIAPEIHAPIELTGKYIESYLDLISRTGTTKLGFTLDLGIFCREIPLAAREQALRHGAQADLVAYIHGAFRNGVPQGEVVETVRSRGGSDAAVRLAMHYKAFGPASNRVEDLARIVPHICNVHGKFYVMTPDADEPTIPYREVIAALASGGYRGSIDSEYEGQRLTQDAFQTDSCEQVRRHHLMVRRMIAEAGAAAEIATEQSVAG